jgi:hypothetical protein
MKRKHKQQDEESALLDGNMSEPKELKSESLQESGGGSLPKSADKADRLEEPALQQVFSESQYFPKTEFSDFAIYVESNDPKHGGHGVVFHLDRSFLLRLHPHSKSEEKQKNDTKDRTKKPSSHVVLWYPLLECIRDRSSFSFTVSDFCPETYEYVFRMGLSSNQLGKS